jgi:hypothetical protein
MLADVPRRPVRAEIAQCDPRQRVKPLAAHRRHGSQRKRHNQNAKCNAATTTHFDLLVEKSEIPASFAIMPAHDRHTRVFDVRLTTQLLAPGSTTSAQASHQTNKSARQDCAHYVLRSNFNNSHEPTLRCCMRPVRWHAVKIEWHSVAVEWIPGRSGGP